MSAGKELCCDHNGAMHHYSSFHTLMGRSLWLGFWWACTDPVTLILEARVNYVNQVFLQTIQLLIADALGYVLLPLGNSHTLSKGLDWFCFHPLVDIYLEEMNKKVHLLLWISFFSSKNCSLLWSATVTHDNRNADLLSCNNISQLFTTRERPSLAHGSIRVMLVIPSVWRNCHI